MKQAGRNDTCPCGSGKKFKKCCIGRPADAAMRMIETPGTEARRIELVNFAKFNEALGVEVVSAFSRCFVHTDRLTSMVNFAALSLDRYGENSAAFGRDLHTMVWFTVGTMRELALAIRGLRNALAKKHILDAESSEWLHLREIEDRWDRDATFTRIRNKAAFHVDSEVIQHGIEVLIGAVRDVELFRGDNSLVVQSSFTLGNTVLHSGVGWDLESYGHFLDQVTADINVVVDAIQRAFVEATEAVGIRVE